MRCSVRAAQSCWPGKGWKPTYSAARWSTVSLMGDQDWVLGTGSPGVLAPVLLPSCGRAEVNVLELTRKVQSAIEAEKFTVPMRVAVMGCVVNGPGEAREADVGIASGNGLGFIIVKGEVVAKVPEEELVGALLTEARKVAAEKVAAGEPEI